MSRANVVEGKQHSRSSAASCSVFHQIAEASRPACAAPSCCARSRARRLAATIVKVFDVTSMRGRNARPAPSVAVAASAPCSSLREIGTSPGEHRPDATGAACARHFDRRDPAVRALRKDFAQQALLSRLERLARSRSARAHLDIADQTCLLALRAEDIRTALASVIVECRWCDVDDDRCDSKTDLQAAPLHSRRSTKPRIAKAVEVDLRAAEASTSEVTVMTSSRLHAECAARGWRGYDDALVYCIWPTSTTLALSWAWVSPRSTLRSTVAPMPALSISWVRSASRCTGWPLIGNDDVAKRAGLRIDALQPRLLRRRARHGSHHHDALNAKPRHGAFVGRNDADAGQRHAPVADELRDDAVDDIGRNREADAGIAAGRRIDCGVHADQPAGRSRAAARRNCRD